MVSKKNCHKTNMYKIFQKQDIDTRLLTSISIALEIDFFSYYSDFVNGKNEKKDSQTR
jgi:hypothetical protein